MEPAVALAQRSACAVKSTASVPSGDARTTVFHSPTLQDLWINSEKHQTGTHTRHAACLRGVTRTTYLWAAAVWCVAVGAARADAPTAPPPPTERAYALLVASNPGGAGQGTLQFAETDAARVADVLMEVGRVPDERTELLLGPEPQQVLEAIAKLQDQLQTDREQGRQTRVFFYYSGHARANALNLGAQQLPLDQLRDALLDLPTTLTVVVLDACQSGAFSNVKGASPAADFSHNSVQRLRTKGVAVMASSTGAELSQESSELGSSYFTHHLVVALRGAGDRNEDGRVSLDEAYRYAYEHTLASTSRTAVGSQHVTLETELTGQGDVALSYPAEASAQLMLPAELQGTVLIQQRNAGSVMAELVKAAGRGFSLALPPGFYDAVVRQGDDIVSCPVQLNEQGRHVLDTTHCTRVEPEIAQDKGAAEPFELWFAELGFGPRFDRNGAFTRRLRTFRFQEDEGLFQPLTASVTAGLNLHPHVGVFARYHGLGLRRFNRDLHGPGETSPNEHFEWRSYAVMTGARARLPLWSGRLALYAQAGLGLGLSNTELFVQQKTTRERHFGVVLQGAAGLTVRFFRYLGYYVEASYTHAPIVDNLVGDTHDDGGFAISQGLRVHNLGDWQ